MNETEVLKKDDEEDIEVIEEAEEEAKPEPEKASGEKAEKEEPESAKKSDDELGGISESVKKRIDKLTFKMREAERREQAALDYARSLQAESQAFKQKAAQLDQSLISEYENRIKTQQQLVVDKLKSAVESGDVDAQIDAQKLLSTLAVEEERVRVVKNRPQPQQQPVQQPVPQQRAPARPDPRAEAWAERNEWFGQDKAMTATAFVIHSQLVEEEGFDPTGDDYYSELDKRIRTEFPQRFKKPEAPAPAAVASARPTGRSDSNPKQVKLTRSQIEIARKLGVSVKDYARQLQKLAR